MNQMPEHTFIQFLGYLAVMVIVTYLLRLLPMLLIQKPIRNRFIRSLLYYIPYSVLTVMTFPAIFYIAPHTVTSILATALAIFLAYKNKSLITVAAGAAALILICEISFMLLT
jgi:branched-subunit amino acid transport protein